MVKDWSFHQEEFIVGLHLMTTTNIGYKKGLFWNTVQGESTSQGNIQSYIIMRFNQR